ncbi:MAG: hypothetical protein QOG91_192 [Candidatus Parcubacteria bacterium]|jgi:protein-disulfide isomerase|nr:hypothetical protein [Candidatus Parcubacteria bacterium]
MKRAVFWSGFVIILALIVWGMIVALNKPVKPIVPKLGTPAPVTAADHVSTASDTPVTLVEYSDFQCPACESYYPLVTRLLSEASTTVRLVYRHFPLNDIRPDGTVLHPNALAAAEASEAAAKQGKFWEMYNLLFDKHPEWTELPDPRPVFEKYAADLGLDAARFKADIDAVETKNLVLSEKQEGSSLGINATPTFFVNDKAIANPQSYEEFKSIIETAASTSTP